ncbi:MAG: regulatory protein RecX [Lachnospiraceae bacterium]|jgi:regulatory protein|nr:regulatory protein RecX [Lachnospiraceae bacterium]
MVVSVVRLDQKRSRVLFDQDLALVLYPEDIRKFSIREGRELTEEDYERLLNQVLKPRAKERVLKTLMVSDKTEKHLRKLLQREGYPKEAVEASISMALSYRYIDDSAYAARYLESCGKKKSRRQLMWDMQKKGFSNELVQELLREHPVDEKEQIRSLLEKKGYCPGEKLDQKTYGKFAGMLARKGYSYEAVSAVLKESSLIFD